MYVPQVETSEGAPQLDVSPASAMAVGICPLSTNCLMFFSDRFAAVSQLGGEGNRDVTTLCVGDGCGIFGCSLTWQGGGTFGGWCLVCYVIRHFIFIGYCVITS